MTAMSTFVIEPRGRRDLSSNTIIWVNHLPWTTMDDYITVHITSNAETYLNGCSGEMLRSPLVYVCGSHGYKYSRPTKTSYQTWDA